MAMKFYSDIELEQHYNINGKSALSKLTLSKMSPLAGGIDLLQIFDKGTTIDLDKLIITGRYYSSAYTNNFTLQIKTPANASLPTYTLNRFVGCIIVEDAIGDIEEELVYRHKRQRIRVRNNALVINKAGHQVDGCRVEFIRHFEINSDNTITWGEWQVTVLPHVWGGVIGLPELYLSTLNSGNTDVGAAIQVLSGSIQNAGTSGQGWNGLYLKTLNQSNTEVGNAIQIIQTRLNNLGFNKGGKISMSINSGTSNDIGHIYKIGDLFYGKTFAIHVNKENSQIRTITITITLPEGIAQNDVKSLMIFPPQILTTSINTGGKYDRVKSQSLTTMEHTSYTFTYTNNYLPDPPFTTDVELSECIILGTTNINHALPSKYNDSSSGSGSESSGTGSGTKPGFGTMVELK